MVSERGCSLSEICTSFSFLFNIFSGVTCIAVIFFFFFCGGGSAAEGSIALELALGTLDGGALGWGSVKHCIRSSPRGKEVLNNNNNNNNNK